MKVTKKMSMDAFHINLRKHRFVVQYDVTAIELNLLIQTR
jgi:hypothetical protein